MQTPSGPWSRHRTARSARPRASRGRAGGPLGVTIANDGVAPLHIRAVTALGGPFAKIADTCTGATIASVTGSCTVSTAYAPFDTLGDEGALDVSSDDADGDLFVDL